MISLKTIFGVAQERVTTEPGPLTIVIPEKAERPRIVVGESYPIMFGGSPMVANVTRIAQQTSGLTVFSDIMFGRTRSTQMDSLDRFVERVKDRAMYEACSVSSVEVPDRLMR